MLQRGGNRKEREMMKLIRLRLETQDDRTLRVRMHYFSVRVEPQIEGNGSNRAWRHRLSVAVLTSFAFIGELLCDL
jgi:hypothetical protein